MTGQPEPRRTVSSTDPSSHLRDTPNSRIFTPGFGLQVHVSNIYRPLELVKYRTELGSSPPLQACSFPSPPQCGRDSQLTKPTKLQAAAMGIFRHQPDGTALRSHGLLHTTLPGDTAASPLSWPRLLSLLGNAPPWAGPGRPPPHGRPCLEHGTSFKRSPPHPCSSPCLPRPLPPHTPHVSICPKRV